MISCSVRPGQLVQRAAPCQPLIEVWRTHSGKQCFPIEPAKLGSTRGPAAPDLRRNTHHAPVWPGQACRENLAGLRRRASHSGAVVELLAALWRAAPCGSPPRQNLAISVNIGPFARTQPLNAQTGQGANWSKSALHAHAASQRPYQSARLKGLGCGTRDASEQSGFFKTHVARHKRAAGPARHYTAGAAAAAVAATLEAGG